MPARAMMVFADRQGRYYDHPDLEMVGWDGECWRPLADEELAPIPRGSDIFVLPGRKPAGFDRAEDQVVILDEPGISAASVFLAPAYLRMLLPAYQTAPEAPALPLFAYSAVGMRDGELVAPAVRVDPDPRQDPYRFDIADIESRVADRRQALAHNRLVGHLGHCATVYHCRAAQNYFLDRYEAPLPAAPTCNAVCVGCISFQPPGRETDYIAAHSRIQFAPTPEELSEVALGHIARVGDDAVVSFGQGCEGEPLNQAEELDAMVRLVRRSTSQGVLNLNSNASRPECVDRLCRAGLDSLRISTNSARPLPYAAYYRPTSYGFQDVRRSARVIREHGRYLMLNYFVFPGFTDTLAELDALSAWIDEVGIDMVQLRNLNLDPEVYLAAVGEQTEPMGLGPWLVELLRRHPRLRLGYFNPPRRLMRPPEADERPLASRSSAVDLALHVSNP
jgi:pyruvate-formate lyase-activating enzyme